MTSFIRKLEFKCFCGWLSFPRGQGDATFSGGHFLKGLFTPSLPIRKWGRNSEFRFDLHPSPALFFCCYSETQWCVCGREVTAEGHGAILGGWPGVSSGSLRVPSAPSRVTPGLRLQRRPCSELPGQMPWSRLLVVLKCKALPTCLEGPSVCQGRGVWVLGSRRELWGLCFPLGVLSAHHHAHLLSLLSCGHLRLRRPSFWGHRGRPSRTRCGACFVQAADNPMRARSSPSPRCPWLRAVGIWGGALLLNFLVFFFSVLM